MLFQGHLHLTVSLKISLPSGQLDIFYWEYASSIYFYASALIVWPTNKYVRPFVWKKKRGGEEVRRSETKAGSFVYPGTT